MLERKGIHDPKLLTLLVHYGPKTKSMMQEKKKN